MVKVFYVEDEPFLAKIVRETLESHGFEVHHVADGSLALDAYLEFAPDICILDIMLPRKDGFEIGHEIREQNESIPIIFLTAKDQTQDVVKGFSLGGNDYIKKPFSMEELIVRIENLLKLSHRSFQQEISDQFEIGSIKFDSEKMELTGPGGIQRLSHRENEILKMLCDCSDGKVERKDILLEIWGDDSFFNSRNLDVYIRKIRKYLSQDPGVELITLKGIGYRLVR